MQPLIQFLTTPLSQHLSKLLEQRIGVLDLRMNLANPWCARTGKRDAVYASLTTSSLLDEVCSCKDSFSKERM
jgi:hypothetical protein